MCVLFDQTFPFMNLGNWTVQIQCEWVEVAFVFHNGVGLYKYKVMLIIKGKYDSLLIYIKKVKTF
jgi:hypothetical protein